MGWLMGAKAIQTHYAGFRFRSRLEARWAVFFDRMKIPWDPEPQGFVVDGRAYLPDFRLTDCGTWVEVKGAEEELDHDLMLAAARHLPDRPLASEGGPRLLILGPIPDPPETGDLGWIGLDEFNVWCPEIREGGETFDCTVQRGWWRCSCGWDLRRDGEDFRAADLCEHLLAYARRPPEPPDEQILTDQWWGFGGYHDRKCPRILTGTSGATAVDNGEGAWLTPAADEYAETDLVVLDAYRAARSARFEHGEKG